MTAVPITVITGFLGSGKTTLILNLLQQLPTSYRVALIKNEFGDVAIDSQLTQEKAISGVQELLNGCICCNLVGSLKDALETLLVDRRPDRFIIETSGSAFPATLALEINRLARETGNYTLDGVISVIDVENWRGYEDTSYTAKIQAKYTDLLVLNKWELVDERAYEDCIDRILDLDLSIPTPRTKSAQGWVEKNLIFGLDPKLLKSSLHDLRHAPVAQDHHAHQSEVDVLSVRLVSEHTADGLRLDKFQRLLTSAPKDEVYRIKAVLFTFEAPCSSDGESIQTDTVSLQPSQYILNWSFGRWSFTKISKPSTSPTSDTPTPGSKELLHAKLSEASGDSILRMTVITARFEAKKWADKIRNGQFLSTTKNPVNAEIDVRILA